MSTSRRRSIALIACWIAAACEPGRGPADPGSADFNAAVGGVLLRIQDSSVNAGDVKYATATAVDAHGHRLNGPAIMWSVGDTTVLTLLPLSDTTVGVWGRTRGRSTVTATAGGRSSSIPVTVVSAGVAQVFISLPSSTVPIGQRTKASAFPFDSSGNQLTGRSIAWASLNPSVATVGADGTIIAVASGSAMIRATIDSQSGEALLSVDTNSGRQLPANPTASVTVTVDSTNVTVGHSAQATAIAKDSTGKVLSGKTASWFVQNSAVASVTASGVVTGESAGGTLVQATIDGVTGSGALTVVAAAAPNPTTPSPSTPGSTPGSTPPSTPPAAPPAGPPPTPSPGYPNQPSSFSQLALQTFDTPDNADFYGVGAYTTVVDPTSPDGSSNVGQMTFATGFSSGIAPAGLYQRSAPFPRSPRQIYISFWVKLSSNWVGNAAGANKILYMRVNGQNAGSVEFIGMGGLDPSEQTLGPMLVLENVVQVTRGSGASGSGSVTVTPNMVPYTSSTAITRGQWGHYEVLETLNTPGQADGGVKWWWNGQLYGDYTGRVQWTDTPNAAFTEVYWNPTYGGLGPPVPDTQYMWMKTFYVSGG